MGEKMMGGKSNPYPGNADQTFLHGHLYIDIFEAKNLPDMEGKRDKIS